MFRRKIWIFGFLLLTLILVPSVFATPPTEFDDGWWGNTQFGDGTVSFDFVVPSIGLAGTATQPAVTPGRAAHGFFVGRFYDGPIGECAYTVATFTLPNEKLQQPFHATMTRCTGGFEGLHITGVGWIDFDAFPLFEGPWEGSFHFDP